MNPKLQDGALLFKCTVFRSWNLVSYIGQTRWAGDLEVLETFVREKDEIPPAPGKMMTPRGPQASLLLADPPITSATFYPTVIVQRKVRPLARSWSCAAHWKMTRDCRLAYSHMIHFQFLCASFYLCISSAKKWNLRGGTVVKVLCCKSECRWFDSRWFHWNFSLT